MTQTRECLRIPENLGSRRGFYWVSCAYSHSLKEISPQCNEVIRFFRVNALARVYASIRKICSYMPFSLEFS